MLTANLIKLHLGIPLTAQEEELEAQLKSS